MVNLLPPAYINKLTISGMEGGLCILRVSGLHCFYDAAAVVPPISTGGIYIVLKIDHIREPPKIDHIRALYGQVPYTLKRFSMS